MLNRIELGLLVQEVKRLTTHPKIIQLCEEVEGRLSGATPPRPKFDKAAYMKKYLPKWRADQKAKKLAARAQS